VEVLFSFWAAGREEEDLLAREWKVHPKVKRVESRERGLSSSKTLRSCSSYSAYSGTGPGDLGTLATSQLDERLLTS
jgi:hypothetical protein